MKKILFFIFTSILFYSCKCEREEVGRNLLSKENREYLNTSKRIVKYYNKKNEVMEASFEGSKSVLSEEREGPEVCSYITIENIEESFIFESYKGVVKINNEALFINLNKYDENNVLSLQNVPDNNYDNALQNVQISSFVFNNVLVLEKSSLETLQGKINKIIYSKTYGIEFILFEDGSWYKRVE